MPASRPLLVRGSDARYDLVAESPTLDERAKSARPGMGARSAWSRPRERNRAGPRLHKFKSPRGGLRPIVAEARESGENASSDPGGVTLVGTYVGREPSRLVFDLGGPLLSSRSENEPRFAEVAIGRGNGNTEDSPACIRSAGVEPTVPENPYHVIQESIFVHWHDYGAPSAGAAIPGFEHRGGRDTIVSFGLAWSR